MCRKPALTCTAPSPKATAHHATSRVLPLLAQDGSGTSRAGGRRSPTPSVEARPHGDAGGIAPRFLGRSLSTTVEGTGWPGTVGAVRARTTPQGGAAMDSDTPIILGRSSRRSLEDAHDAAKLGRSYVLEALAKLATRQAVTTERWRTSFTPPTTCTAPSGISRPRGSAGGNGAHRNAEPDRRQTGSSARDQRGTWLRRDVTADA